MDVEGTGLAEGFSVLYERPEGAVSDVDLSIVHGRRFGRPVDLYFGEPMGSVVDVSGTVGIEAQIASPVPIATVSLWRDDRWLEHRAVTGDRGEHNYVVRAQSTADDLPAGPLVAYSSPTYVRSGSGGRGGTWRAYRAG